MTTRRKTDPMETEADAKEPAPYVPPTLKPPLPDRCGSRRYKKKTLPERNAKGQDWEYVLTEDGRKIVAGYCAKKPIAGGKTCTTHGSGTQRAKEKAARVVEEERVRNWLGKATQITDEDLPHIDVVAELQRQLAQSRVRQDALDAYVAQLEEVQLTQEGKDEVEQVGVWVAQADKERERYNALLVQAQKLGLRERALEMRQQEQQAVLALVGWMVQQLGMQVTPDQLPVLMAQGIKELGR